jgi:photosystem II stability/assembly factor-like uncharacterized protein
VRSPTAVGDEAPAGLHIVQIQEASARLLPAAPPLETVDFIDTRHGWAGGAVILATTDGGRTWRRQSSPATTVDVLDFVDHRDGWALGSATVGRAAIVTPLLLRTPDGGRHWRRAAEPRLALHGTRATVHPLQRVHFTDASLGAGVAGPGPNAYYGGPGSRGTAVITMDGGETWRALPTPAPVSSICFANRRVGWAVVAGKGIVLRTTDGGRHWKRIATLPPGGYEPQFFPPSLSFITPHRGWAVASNGRLLATADGGHTWRTLAVPPAWSRDDPQGLLDAVAFVDHRHGCVQTMAVPPQYVGTSDGGAHWRPVLGVTGPAACAAQLAGYPVAAALQQAQRTLQPHDWAFFAGVTGLRQGWDLVDHCEGTSTGRYLSPYLLTTADAGRTWREFPWDNGFWCIPQSLSFATAANSWLLMQGNSHLYRTTDGGATWRELL